MTSPSRRVQITLGGRTFDDLEKLADLAELPIHTEARLLLGWAIDNARARWDRLRPGLFPAVPAEVADTGYTQPVLPLIEVTPEELEQVLDELQARHAQKHSDGPVHEVFPRPIGPS